MNSKPQMGVTKNEESCSQAMFNAPVILRRKRDKAKSSLKISKVRSEAWRSWKIWHFSGQDSFRTARLSVNFSAIEAITVIEWKFVNHTLTRSQQCPGYIFVHKTSSWWWMIRTKSTFPTIPTMALSCAIDVGYVNMSVFSNRRKILAVTTQLK